MAQMDISLFEIIGPVMLGPSSSGTAGMARLGYAAHLFLTGPLQSIDLCFHPRDTGCFGLRSHVALVGGALGMRPEEPALRRALELAKEQGISLSTSKFTEQPLPESALTVKLSFVERSGRRCEITGVSVGGGSIAITNIEGFAVNLSSTASNVFVWAERPVAAELRAMFPQYEIGASRQAERELCWINTGKTPDREAAKQAAQIPGVTRTLALEPFVPLGYVPHTPLFCSFDELIARADATGEDCMELALSYEQNRSGRTRREILEQMHQMLGYMKSAAEEGLTRPVHTLFGFGTGEDGKKLMRAMQEGKTISGSTLNRAVAKALATMEVADAMGCVVAAPTAGSCGIVPGCLLTVAEDKGLDDAAVVKALFACSLIGAALYYHKVSFSGLGGGCQGEIGVSSAMAAGGLACLAGGTVRQVVDAGALALKNMLGLVCDRIGGSSEIPCIRRNGIGVANAFCAADMALSGICSYIPADEVAEALVDCEKRLPPELRGGCGGLTSTKTAARAREIEEEINASLAI